MNSILKQTDDVQLLMMQSLTQKLNMVNAVLSSDGADEDKIQSQFKRITSNFNCGRINLQTYNSRLNELLKRVEAR